MLNVTAEQFMLREFGFYSLPLIVKNSYDYTTSFTNTGIAIDLYDQSGSISYSDVISSENADYSIEQVSSTHYLIDITVTKSEEEREELILFRYKTDSMENNNLMLFDDVTSSFMHIFSFEDQSVLPQRVVFVLDPYIPDASDPLSERCSIDFCEACAIHAAVDLTISHLRAHGRRLHPHPPSRAVATGIDQNDACLSLDIHGIRIISDSLTVLKWIEGSHRIRNMKMKGLISDIHWNLAIFREENGNIPVTLHWTKSHTNTIGNDIADLCSKDGLRAVHQHVDAPYNRWDWYHKRAVINDCRTNFRRDIENDILAVIEQSEFS